MGGGQPQGGAGAAPALAGLGHSMGNPQRSHCPPAHCPLPTTSVRMAQFLGGRGWLTITCTTKSFWILVSCSRVRSVSSLPEKNQRCQAESMPS